MLNDLSLGFKGKKYYRMARLSDEKYAGEITMSKQEAKDELCLDLQSQDAANIANLLRLHLRQLDNNIPCNGW